MTSAGGLSLRRISFTACSLAAASLGFVLGFACFAGHALPFDAYGKFWLLVTACLSAAFLTGLLIDYAMRRAIDVPAILSLERMVARALGAFRLSIERRFRGDRTEEEYQKAEGGVIFTAVALAAIAMLFLVGVWILALAAVLLWLSIARNVFVAFTESRKYGYKTPFGFMSLGFFLAVLYGALHGFS